MDLQSLMALNLTCKSNAYDELSLIQLIENELTRCHGVQTIKKAKSLWRKVYRNSLLKRWMNRNDTTTDEPIRVTRQMLSETVFQCFEVMFHKILRAAPEFECLRMVLMNGKTRDSVMEWLSRSESSGSGTNLNGITMQMQSDR